MTRRAIFLVAFMVMGTCLMSSGRGAIKSYNDLSETQIMALRESETRLIIEDRALQTLENERKHRRISRQEFAYREHDLTAMISEEAQFQNVILIKEPGLPVDAGELLQTIGKYAIEVPVYALAIVARGLAGSSFSFSP